jgi:hypothetical protein
VRSRSHGEIDPATPVEESQSPTADKKKPEKLTPAQKAKAKSRADRAERPYPNLVDNMRIAAEGKRRKKTRN